ncbi:S-adenosyl-L-methionine-dependent methyltransferase [Hypoxylon sp. NC1633]|nr:S-adenosyl-L-methionine-dependent methyltransferase [Hypoxylon sp. NC1633]
MASPQASRVQALEAAKKIHNCLETPENEMLKMSYANPVIWACIRIAVELDVFNMLLEERPVSAEELAKQSGAEEALILRIMRVLTASGYVAEKGVALYGPTKWTRHLGRRTTVGMVKYQYDFATPPTVDLPKFFKGTGFKLPTDPVKGVAQASHGFNEPTFAWFTRPEAQEIWANANTFFESDRGTRPSWASWFPVREKLLKGYDKDLPLLVDVGGGRGHDILDFHEKFRDLEGRLVLQDQQPVLDSAIVELPPRIEKRSIDFFIEAPVKGARIYFMKFIMHDWMDGTALKILKNVSASMIKGYSYLVINDFILPDQGCPLLPALWDIGIFVVLSSQERTESQWKGLLSAAGLSIEGLYQPPGDGQGIVVATLK